MGKVKVAADGTRSFIPCGTAPPSLAPPVLAPPIRHLAPPVPRPVGTPLDPTIVLDELVATVAGVRGAILASVDGFGIARSTSISDAESHPAMLAAAIGLARQLVAIDGGDRLRQLAVDHDAGLMLVWPIGVQRVLALLATPTVEQRRVRSFIRARSDQLSGVAA